MAFSQWDPLRDLLALQEQIERLASAEPPGWTPPMDLYETSDRYVLTAELPGLPRESIAIDLHDGQLTVRGVRPPMWNVPCEHYHRVERGHGSFSRTFALPQAIAADAVTADLRDGVLTVTVPKEHADRSARRITVA